LRFFALDRPSVHLFFLSRTNSFWVNTTVELKKKGHAPPPIMEAFSQNYSPQKSNRPLAKAIPSLWVQLPDIRATEVLFVKDKLPEEFMFPPLATAPSLNM
jgi:hypothetical protein